MYLSKEDIEKTDRIKRLNIINSVTGIKPGNLIGTKSSDGKSNVAIFSSVVHLGSNPALLGFIMRPKDEVRRDTYINIKEKHEYTIDHIHPEFIEKAHYTSAKLKAGISEFERCNLTEEYIDGFNAPFVKESNLKIGLKFLEELPIKLNGTTMLIGQIQHLIIPDHALDPAGHIDLSKNRSVGISGLNNYYEVNFLDQFPYARPDEIPNFEK